MKNVGKLESFAFVSWFEKNTFDFNRHLQGILVTKNEVKRSSRFVVIIC